MLKGKVSKISTVLVTLMLLLSTATVVPQVWSVAPAITATTEIKVESAWSEFGDSAGDLIPIPGTRFTVSVTIYDVVRLFGFTVIFRWNKEYLAYVTHIITDEFVFLFQDEVHPADGWYVLCACSDVIGRTGNIWLFNMTFDVVRQPYYYETGDPLAVDSIDTSLGFISTELWNYTPSPIPHTVEPATVRIWEQKDKATVDARDQALNFEGEGKWFTAYIEFPEGYNLADIDVSSILLNNTILVDPDAPAQIGDHDSDDIPDLMIRFNRTEVANFLLSKGIEYGNVTLTVTGKLDKTMFKGSIAQIRVSPLSGDVNCDGEVDIYDIVQTCAAYGSREEEPNWNPNANYAPPWNKIDIFDIVTITSHYEETYP
jgi:hypothetical protein